MKKAVIFDLDGTLIDSLADIGGAVNTVLKNNGYKEHPLEAYKLFTGDGALNLCKRALLGDETKLDKVYQEYRAYYAQHSRVQTKPFDGIVEMLKNLQQQGMQLIVLSNKDDSDVKNIIKYYFSDISFAHLQGRIANLPIKPDPTLGNMALKKLGLHPDETWYVGDTVTDMKTAHNLGLKSVAVTWGFQTEDMLKTAHPHYFAHSPQELQALLLD